MTTARYSELFGGADRYKALKCLFGNPTRTFGARELAAEAQIDPGNASRWLRRWADAGLLERTQVLQYPRYGVARDPALDQLQKFFQQDSALVDQLRERVARLGPRVTSAAVFGSVARGEATGSSDVDLILVTDMSRLEAQAAFKALARKIGRQIDVLPFTHQQWQESVSTKNPLAMSILATPPLILKGSLDAAA